VVIVVIMVIMVVGGHGDLGIQVESETDYSRVTGSAVGGATFMGLMKMLTPCRSFDEMIELAKVGDGRRVDMLVRDIYGPDYQQDSAGLGLPVGTRAPCGLLCARPGVSVCLAGCVGRRPVHVGACPCGWA
jgi:hypothetical protein